MDTSVVVAVFNSEATVGTLVDELTRVLRACCERFEIILVEDGSADDSWAAIEKAAAGRDDLLAFRLSRNYGEDNAALCGVRHARYETIVTLDDDLQNPPSEIPKLLDELEAGADLVYGRPRVPQQSAGRRLAARTSKALFERMLRVPHARDITTFRAFRTELRDAFAAFDAPTPSLDVLLTWGTDRITTVSVRHDPRRTGRSNYTVPRLYNHTMDMITGYSVAPLRLASVSGAGSTAIGIGTLAFALLHRDDEDVHRFHSRMLASSVSLLAGAELLALGTMGEYLSRMYQKSMAAPTYVIASSIEPD